MAILGGGNPLGGSNPSGIGASISYIGDHMYAYSGEATTLGSQAYSTLLSFTTASNNYIVGDISMFGSVDPTDPTSGQVSNFKISFNDQVLFYTNMDTTQEDHPGQAVVPLLIPPSTTVLIEVNSASSGNNPACSIIGRVY